MQNRLRSLREQRLPLVHCFRENRCFVTRLRRVTYVSIACSPATGGPNSCRVRQGSFVVLFRTL